MQRVEDHRGGRFHRYLARHDLVYAALVGLAAAGFIAGVVVYFTRAG